MRNNISKSNGFGKFEQKIVVRVDSAHADAFAEAFNTKPFRTLPEHSDFIVQTSSKKRGDDETILYEIDYSLPTSIPRNAWTILWDESSY